MHADLLGFVRAACTHASHSGNELPVLPFYVREHVVGWLRPSFADQLRPACAQVALIPCTQQALRIGS